MKKTITLNPGESRAITFSFTPTIAKSYTVSIDGLSGSFVAHEVPVAEFKVIDLIIKPTEVYVGETVEISVSVINIGGATGSYEVTLEVI